MPSPDPSGILMVPRHPVTPEMWEDAKLRTDTPAPNFEVTDTTGKTHTLASLTGEKPLLLYFILDGCPCSIDSEPLFQRLYLHHEGRANFLGVTNGSEEIAKMWVKDWISPYPVAANPSLDVMNTYKVERSVYCLLIDKDGEIVKMWPGYSAEMMVEASKLISDLTGEKTAPFDPLYAPKEMTSGCSFKDGVGK